MKRTVIAALGAGVIAAFAANSAAEAGTINFFFSAEDGSKTYTGSSLETSSAFDLDFSTMLVLDVGPNDASGLSSGSVISLTTAPPPSGLHVITYGDVTPVPPGGRPLGADVILTWPISPAPGADVFTEVLTTVMSIDRSSLNVITVKIEGTITDSTGSSTAAEAAPVELIMTASQAGGPGDDVVNVGFTNKSSVAPPPSVPEPSTWVMMGLGFGALGYAVSRKRKANATMLSV
jgi:hypothetical protein